MASTTDPTAHSANALPDAVSSRLSRRWLAIALAAAAFVVGASFIWWHTRPDTTSQSAVTDATPLDRLPARPEDIEARGAAAGSVLTPDDARARNAAVPFASEGMDIARPFVFRGSDEDRVQALRCLSTAVLYEAGDDIVGEAAVAQVVLNRVRHAAFPATICGVVYQGSQRRTGCQFTFTCDGALQRRMSDAAWTRARAVAENALSGSVNATVGLATHYHTDWVYPYWSPQLRKLARVGTHLFFGWPGGWGGPKAFGRVYRGNEAAIATPDPSLITMPGDDVPPDMAMLPKLPGLPLPPAKLPASMGKVPLYGNKVRLVRPDGRAFGLLAPPGAASAKLVNAALALCGEKPGPCEVAAWSNEDDIPGEYPIPEGARGTMVFEWVRDGGSGKSTLRFDCAMFPNKDTKVCF